MTKYQAVCLVCYTCVLGRNLGKREADRIAVSHMNAYQHATTVQPMPKKERK